MTRLLLQLPLRLSFLKPQPQFQATLPCLFRTLLTPNGRSSGVSNRNSLFYGFSSFCTARDLAAKKCVPCNLNDLRPMAEDSATALMSKVDGWDLVKEDGVLKLNRSLKVKSFTKGLQLFQIVGNLAEAEGHHPDLHLVGWNNVKIEIRTHAVGGLTENDFILAAKINGLNLHDLLRKKAGT